MWGKSSRWVTYSSCFMPEPWFSHVNKAAVCEAWLLGFWRKSCYRKERGRNPWGGTLSAHPVPVCHSWSQSRPQGMWWAGWPTPPGLPRTFPVLAWKASHPGNPLVVRKLRLLANLVTQEPMVSTEGNKHTQRETCPRPSEHLWNCFLTRMSPLICRASFCELGPALNDWNNKRMLLRPGGGSLILYLSLCTIQPLIQMNAE